MHETVRPATPYDAPALHRVAALTFPLACTPHTPDEVKAAFIAEHLSERAFATYLADPALVLLVAPIGGAVDGSDGGPDCGPDGGELAGYAMVSTAAPDDPDVTGALRLRPTAELSKMYVHPAHHGTGVAAALMTAALTAGRRAGAAGIWLGVSEENDRANAFYARHGFQVVGRKRFRLGDRWEQDLVRERAL